MHGRFSSARSIQIHRRAQKADADPPAAWCSTHQSTPLHARYADAATTKTRPSVLSAPPNTWSFSPLCMSVCTYRIARCCKGYNGARMSLSRASEFCATPQHLAGLLIKYCLPAQNTALASGHVDIFAASAVSDSRLRPHSASTASSWPVALGVPAGACFVGNANLYGGDVRTRRETSLPNRRACVGALRLETSRNARAARH
ncbi:hypothetical protein BC567DRAFT_58206 [Phyllosticta citribraziliensis]